MDNTSALSFDIDTTNASVAIPISAWIDDNCIFQTDHVKESYNVVYNINDDESEHLLQIKMSGKSLEHTKIDSSGNILHDIMLQISNFNIDGIDVNQLFQDKIVYTHDFNGTQPEIEDTFHGYMGCNGTLSLKFSTPMYLWLLENM
jgi:hypothetical protein